MKNQKTIGRKLLAIFAVLIFMFTVVFGSLSSASAANTAEAAEAEAFDYRYLDPFVGPGLIAASFMSSSNDDEPDVCEGWEVFSPKTWLNCFLLYVLRFIGKLLSVSSTLFSWIIHPDNVNMVINNQAIYAAWALVRDTLNVAFILVLLFSAFATIFQVEKYNYKKILLTLILMALLVNFSFPIARFIIDAANVLMYYFVNGLGLAESGGIFSRIAEDSALERIINSNVYADTSYLIAAIVFTFILAVTLLIIAVMFVIRTVALAILIIFSPVAFVGTIIPSAAGRAGKWWDNLFKYAFFGPIMAFMIYVALTLLGYISTAGLGNMNKIAANQADDPGFIAAVAFFTIPIVILWIGLGIAQSMSIEGAGLVTGKGKKFLGWAGRNLGGARPVVSWTSKKMGVTGGYKAKYADFKKRGFFGSDKQAEREAKVSEKWAGFGLGKNKGAMDEFNRKKVQQIKDDWKKQGGISKDELLKYINDEKKDMALRQAAALEFTDKYGFDDDPKKAYADYDNIIKNVVGSDETLKKSVNDNVKKKRLDLILNHAINNPGDDKTSDQVAREKLEGLQTDDYKNINFESFFANSDVARKATEDYFKENVSMERQAEIAKKVSGKNERFVENLPNKGSAKSRQAGFTSK